MLDIAEYFPMKPREILYFTHGTHSNEFSSLKDNSELINNIKRIQSNLEQRLYHDAFIVQEEVLPHLTEQRVYIKEEYFEGKQETLREIDLVGDLQFWALFLCYLRIVWVEEWADQEITDILAIPGMSFKWSKVKTYQDVFDVFSSKTRVFARVIYDPDSKQYFESIFAANRHEAMSYQLLSYIAHREECRNGYSISTCTSCGKSYLKMHGNAKFCKHCSTGAARQKAFRDRKKKEAANEP